MENEEQHTEPRRRGTRSIPIEQRRQARRDLVVLLGSLLAVALPAILAAVGAGILGGKLFGNEPGIPAVLLVLLLGEAFMLILFLPSSYLFMILMSYILSLEEYLYYSTMRVPDVPVLTRILVPILNTMSEHVVRKKMKREKRERKP